MVGMITNISDRKDTKILSYHNTLRVEIKFHWQIIAFFLLYRWHSLINNVSLFTLEAIISKRLYFLPQRWAHSFAKDDYPSAEINKKSRTAKQSGTFFLINSSFVAARRVCRSASDALR